jgi:hypothetical protein
MKELIEKILAYLPRYLTNFGSLFVGPKRFIGQRNTAAEDTFGESLLFLGISLVLVVIMTAPLLPPGKDLWTYVGAQAVTYLLAVSLAALALRLAWRIVGGKATIRSFFVTYAYFFGVIIVIYTLFLLLAEGVFKVLDPDLYAEVIEAKLNKQARPDLSGSTIPMISFGIQLVGFVLLSGWGFVAWGAYRELNGLSKWRSFFASTIMGLLSCPIAAIVFFVASAVS